MASHTFGTAPAVARIAARIPEAPPGIGPSREAIAEAVVAIAVRFQPERIVLCGSRVYGVPTSESDADLMVVMETPLSGGEQTDLVRRAIAEWRPPGLHVMVRTPEQIRIGLEEGDFFVRDIIVKGVTLFGATGVGPIGVHPRSDEQAGSRAPGLKRATRDWLGHAEGHVRMAELFVDMPDLPGETFCDHAQEGAKTYLRALLQERQIELSRTQDVVDLAGLASELLPEIGALEPDLQWLSRFTIDVCYAGPAIEDVDAGTAARIATNVGAQVRAALELPEVDG